MSIPNHEVFVAEAGQPAVEEQAVAVGRDSLCPWAVCWARIRPLHCYGFWYQKTINSCPRNLRLIAIVIVVELQMAKCQ